MNSHDILTNLILDYWFLPYHYSLLVQYNTTFNIYCPFLKPSINITISLFPTLESLSILSHNFVKNPWGNGADMPTILILYIFFHYMDLVMSIWHLQKWAKCNILFVAIYRTRRCNPLPWQIRTCVEVFITKESVPETWFIFLNDCD